MNLINLIKNDSTCCSCKSLCNTTNFFCWNVSVDNYLTFFFRFSQQPQCKKTFELVSQKRNLETTWSLTFDEVMNITSWCFFLKNGATRQTLRWLTGPKFDEHREERHAQNISIILRISNIGYCGKISLLASHWPKVSEYVRVFSLRRPVFRRFDSWRFFIFCRLLIPVVCWQQYQLAGLLFRFIFVIKVSSLFGWLLNN